MVQTLKQSVLLLTLSVLICCVIYPSALWVIGQVFFPFQANGSMVQDAKGNVVGSLLIAQPFTKEAYFQPRPSAAAYDASASASSALAASNHALRNRVASALGSIAKYRSGAKAGQAVAPDILAWFQKDKFAGQPHIVAQWATLHKAAAQAWVNADAAHAAYIDSWSQTHAAQVNQFVKDNPLIQKPKAADLVSVFFQNFSTEYPGKFPVTISRKTADGKTVTAVGPVNSGTDIQANFFDMWLQDHPDVELQNVPGDMVTTSGSGLDPHITLENALYQLDRVAGKWAVDLQRDTNVVKHEITQILNENASAAFAGLAGERVVNVLQVNLELERRYGMTR